MPTNKEIAEWLREAADGIEQEIAPVPDGPHVLVWGGEYSEHDAYTGSSFTIPCWWFRVGSDFEEVANPTHWMPLPGPPQTKEGKE